MQYRHHLIPLITVTILNLWTCNIWAADSTQTLRQTTVKPKTYAPALTPVTKTVVIRSSATTAPNDAVCPTGYTLTSLNYKNGSGYADSPVFKPTGGACTTWSSKIKFIYGSSSSSAACPSGYKQTQGQTCDDWCNNLYGGPAGGYCYGQLSYSCLYIGCQQCLAYAGSWVSSSSVLGSGEQLIGFREATCTDLRPSWR